MHADRSVAVSENTTIQAVILCTLGAHQEPSSIMLPFGTISITAWSRTPPKRLYYIQ